LISSSQSFICYYEKVKVPPFGHGLLYLSCAIATLVNSKADFIDLPADASEWRFTGRTGNLIDRFGGIAEMEERDMGAHAGVFGTTSGAGDPNIPGNVNGAPISYMYFDGYSGRGEGYRVWSGTSDSEHQEFTMIFDLFVPASNNSAHLSFFNGNDNNINDADYLLTRRRHLRAQLAPAIIESDYFDTIVSMEDLLEG
jgi:hypothetical protein